MSDATAQAVAALRRRYDLTGDARHWLAWMRGYLALPVEERPDAWPRPRPSLVATPTPNPNAEGV